MQQQAQRGRRRPADPDVTRPLCERIKGIFGTGLAAYGVTEVNGRFAKHALGLFWGGDGSL